MKTKSQWVKSEKVMRGAMMNIYHCFACFSPKMCAHMVSGFVGFIFEVNFLSAFEIF